MKRPLVILAVLLVALVVLKMYAASYLETEGFEGQGPEVVIAKAAWCGHCKAAMPEFEKLVSASPITLKNGQKATVRMLDADTDKSALESIGYKVRGYPTILFIRGGDIKEHTGDRTKDSVIAALNQAGAA